MVGDLQQDTATAQQVARYGDLGLAEENEVAFSSNSASRCTTSLTTCPRTAIPGCTFSDHPLVLLDLRDGGAQHVHQRDRLGSSAAEASWPASTSRFSELRRIRVARWSSRNRLAEPLGVLLALLQIVDEVDLPFHQGLGAAGQVDEHGVDVPAQRRLVGGQPDRLLVHLVEGARHLPDLVGGVHVDGHDLQWALPSPSVSLIRRTVSGSRTPATSRAPVRSRRSGPTMDLPTMIVKISASARTSEHDHGADDHCA